MIKKMLCILGRSGAGKDTLAMKLEKDYSLSRVISYTTRPRRQGECGTHIFVTKDQADTLTDRAAETQIGEYEYFTTREQIDSCSIYVIDPNGLDMLVKKFDDRLFLAVYVASDPAKAREHAIIRGGSPAEGAIFDKRRLAEDGQFTRFENDIRACRGIYRGNCAAMWIDNDYTESCMDNAAKKVFGRFCLLG